MTRRALSISPWRKEEEVAALELQMARLTAEVSQAKKVLPTRRRHGAGAAAGAESRSGAGGAAAAAADSSFAESGVGVSPGGCGD